MKLLLDTHILVWLTAEPKRLHTRERAVLASPTSDISISAVSIWEIRLKWQARHPSGERKLSADPSVVLLAVQRMGFNIVALTERHAATPLSDAVAHKDPFDELLLVQAQEEGMRLFTRDTLLENHPLALYA